MKEEDIREVKKRSDIAKIISEHIELKKIGRNLKGLCPFHQEKNPSFTVDPVKQRYRCFGCGESGDVIGFVMRMNNLDFARAVKYLADRAGYSIHFLDSKEGERKRHLRQMRLYEATGQAAEFYNRLLKAEKGKRVRSFLKACGCGSGSIWVFRIGYAPAKEDALLNYMCGGKGFKPEELAKAGLAVKEEGGFADRLKDKIVFPVLNMRGKVAALGAAEEKDGRLTYEPPPETTIYQEGSTLYGLFEAKSEIVARAGQALVAEGPPDTVLLHEKGMKNAVSPCGGTFSPGHLRLLAHFANRAILSPDINAEWAKLMGEAKIEVLVLPSSDAKDPKKLKGLLQKAVPLADFCFDRIFLGYDAGSSESRIRTAQKILSFAATLPSANREAYLKKAAQRLKTSLDLLLFELEKKTSEEA